MCDLSIKSIGNGFAAEMSKDDMVVGLNGLNGLNDVLLLFLLFLCDDLNGCD